MFDPKSLLEAIMRGGAQQPRAGAPEGLGGLSDILGQLGRAAGGPQSGGRPSGSEAPGAGAGGLGDILGQLGKALGGPGAGGQTRQGGQGGGGGLDDLLRNVLGGAAGGVPGRNAISAEEPGATPKAGAPAGGGAGGLGDLLGQLQQQLGKGGGGSLMDILGQVLGQATQGVKEGAQRIDQATGASGHARDAVTKATGTSPGDLLEQLKDLVQKNQLGAGAAAGGLGAVVLGTKTGRSLAANALKLGGLALIGGLAYKALQNYQQGRPILSSPQQLALAAAPEGSGFEASAVTNEAALLYVRGMIAAAAADGRIDATELARITAGLKQSGLGEEAEAFIAQELNNPAGVQDLVDAVSSEEEAVQLFTAARVSVDLDTNEEHDFLVALAEGLRLDSALVQHIDSMARATG